MYGKSQPYVIPDLIIFIAMLPRITAVNEPCSHLWRLTFTVRTRSL